MTLIPVDFTFAIHPLIAIRRDPLTPIRRAGLQSA